MKVLFPNDIILKTETFNVGQDWEVPIEAFFIIGANDKTKRSFQDFSSEELHELVDVLKKVRVTMEQVLNIKDVYIFQNEDTEHGFHVWMFPRHDWMEKFGRKIESVRPIMNTAVAERSVEPYISEVRQVAEKLRSHLN